jgi:stage V sporulation protein AF
MEKLVLSYDVNLRVVRSRLRVDENFDVIERRLTIGGKEASFFYIDGFVKDGEMLRLMQFLISEKKLLGAEELERTIPYVEVERVDRVGAIVRAVLAGQSALLAESFGGEAILLDLRTYPARDTAEPESDRVMQGPRDGFVETLVMNTALIRRRIRDPNLTMEHISMGGASDTDVVICYVKGLADKRDVDGIRERLKAAKPYSLTLGFQSLAELLVGKGWFNPFPKIRTTERPDTASAQLLEGSVIVLCDTSPLAMILPTSIFDYLEESGDFYFPPLTGTYLRLVRIAILLLSVVTTPLWYLAIEYEAMLPESLLFLIPDEPGALPIILQLFLAEIAIDGLKIASMNTPDILSNSLSVVGALILGDFAVSVGWLCEDVILYMAFVAIANFAQQNHELGYAFKFVRIMTLFLVWILGGWGFAIGMLLFALLVVTNTTPPSSRGYLYPLIPFNGKDLLHYLYRRPKKK